MSLTTLAIILHFFVVSLSMPQCRDMTYGRTCELPSQPTRIMATSDGILVGVTNALYSFDTFLSYKASANLTPPYEATTGCEQFHPGVGECLNYVLVLTQVPLSSPFHAGEVLVCGTNARQPKCYFFNPSDLSKVSPLSNDTSADAGYCPYQSDKSVASFVTSNGYLFSGTTFNEFTSQGSIGLARNALRGDKMFVTTSSTIQTWINKGDPSFISIYELSGCVYFFLTEQAAETGNAQVYSRVVRVCINDSTIPTYGFRTFQKARIMCTNAPDQSSLAYSYDELKATTLFNGILYGIFSSAANGPKGAAICKFSFDSLSDSITAAFGTGKYLVSSPSGTSWQQQTESPFSCPGVSRTMEQIANNILVFSPVQPLSSTPLLQVLGNSFTAIAADTFSSFGRVYEVLYYALDGGGIEQLVITNGLSYRSPLIAAAGNRYRYVTRQLILRKAADNVRQLYATTNNSLDTYTLGNCSLYVDCLACLQSMDPYCVWNISTQACASRLDTRYPDGLIEGFALNTTAVFRVCGVENNAGNMNTSAPGASTNVLPSLCASSATPAVLGVEQQPASSVPAGVVAGAAIGGFSAGIPIGVLLCAVALIVKRVVFADSGSDGCAEVGVCKKGSTLANTCKNGGTPETICKPDNINRDCAMKGVCTGGVGPTHNTVDSSYQGYQNGHQMGSQESGDDDVIVELGAMSGAHVSSTNKSRTESTRWLTKIGSNESSDPDSPPV
eukprot:Em0019g573a